MIPLIIVLSIAALLIISKIQSEKPFSVPKDYLFKLNHKHKSTNN